MTLPDILPDLHPLIRAEMTPGNLRTLDRAIAAWPAQDSEARHRVWLKYLAFCRNFTVAALKTQCARVEAQYLADTKEFTDDWAARRRAEMTTQPWTT